MSKKKVKVGNLTLGGEHIYIQSMLNIPADDVEGNVRQAIELEKAGCEIIRTAVPAVRNSELIYALKNAVNIPVVADIHFDYRIALECAAAGVDKIRINPGNIGDKDRVKAVADACRNRNIPSVSFLPSTAVLPHRHWLKALHAMWKCSVNLILTI